MNEWEIKYVFNGHRTVYIVADSLEAAVAIWRADYGHVPAIALYSVVCVK